MAGNKLAMAELYDRYSSTCYAIAMRILDSTAAAEEVTREVLLDVWRQPVNYKSRIGALPVCLILTARRRALEFHNSKGRGADENCIIPMPDPHQLGLSNSQSWRPDKFKRTIAALPGDQKQLLELVWFKGLSSEELAQQTGLTQDRFEARLHAAIDALHRALDADE